MNSIIFRKVQRLRQTCFPIANFEPDYKGADKDIEKARESLGKSNPQEQSGNGDKSETDPADKQSGDKQENASAAAGQEKNKIDNKQADALLENMGQDEKNLRDAIRANQRQRRMKPVEKDW